MFRWFRSVKRSAQVQPSRPVVEGLEGRSLMSATLLDSDVAASSHAAGGGGGAGKVSTNDFHFVMTSGKVSTNDFNFVMKVSKPSPKL